MIVDDNDVTHARACLHLAVEVPRHGRAKGRVQFPHLIRHCSYPLVTEVDQVGSVPASTADLPFHENCVRAHLATILLD
eukprot:3207644-Pyramimonas_sp.AAC.1